MTPGARRLEYGTQVTSEQDPRGQDAAPGSASPGVDPVYDALFRPADPAEPASPAAPPAQAPAPEPEQPAAPGTPGADTGRLFRSQGVEGHSEAVLALDSGRFSRLRTLERDTGAAPAVVTTAAVAETSEPSYEPTPEDAAVASLLAPPPADVYAPPGDALPAADSRRSSRRSRGARAAGSAGLRAGGVYLIVIGVTVIIGFANALLGGGTLGWPTGVALLASSVYASLTVRREDDYSAFLTPPLAFAAAALTAGQLFLGSNESGLLNRLVVAFFSLADNWVWIIGSTLIALIIVLVRRRRG